MDAAAVVAEGGGGGGGRRRIDPSERGGGRWEGLLVLVALAAGMWCRLSPEEAEWEALGPPPTPQPGRRFTLALRLSI